MTNENDCRRRLQFKKPRETNGDRRINYDYLDATAMSAPAPINI